MKSIFQIAPAALLLAGCVASGTLIAKTEAVTSGYSSIGFGGSGKTFVVLAASATQHEGKVSICAALGENRDANFSAQSVTYVKNGVAFFLDGDRLMASAPFAPVYEGANSLRGKATRCAVTDKPWKSSYNGKRVKMSIKRGYIGS